jgi:hypothetical protein
MAILEVLQPEVTTAYARKIYIVLPHVPKVRGQFAFIWRCSPSRDAKLNLPRYRYTFRIRQLFLLLTALANRHNQMSAIQDIFPILILPFPPPLNFLLYMYHFSFELLIPHYVDSY